MSIIKRAGDLVYTFRFLKLLVTPFEKTKAFDLGLIDQDGKRIKSQKIETSQHKSAYTPFHRLVFNIKRIMSKAPGGGSAVASYAAALFLIKEKFGIDDKTIEKALVEHGIDRLDILAEQSQWFMLDNDVISPGVYRIRQHKIVNSTFEELVQSGDKIRISEHCSPVGDLFGLNVYEATHMRSNQKIYVTVGELLK